MGKTLKPLGPLGEVVIMQVSSLYYDLGSLSTGLFILVPILLKSRAKSGVLQILAKLLEKLVALPIMFPILLVKNTNRLVVA